MSYNIFLISDTHFGHQGCYEFFNYDGTKMRPWDNYTDADEIMVQNWNNTIQPTDKVYILGDVVFKASYGNIILPRLNGKKILIKGNHDLCKLSFYGKYFYDIRGCHNFENYIMTHIPVHPDSKARFVRNLHGHVHANTLRNKWYKNCCVEVNNYTPISFEDIKKETQELIDNDII